MTMVDGARDTKAHPSKSGGKIPAYCPPTDFRNNVEAGLRTALSLGLTFLWLEFGPFGEGLSFFAGVTAIVCVGNSAGQTISRSLMITHGALIGAICAIFPQWVMQWGHGPAAASFFVTIFLVLRSRRLTSLGKKFGCLGVTILVLGRMSDDGLTLSWWRFASSYIRVNVEGGVFALVALLFPYPRLATQDGALRAQFMCRSMSQAVDACVTGFIKARDETSISSARLLCLQVRHNLEVVRMELQWSRLELGLLFGGCCAGGMQSADDLQKLAELIEQVLQAVRGMRQSMQDMHRTRAQASFSRFLVSALREVSTAVDEKLEVVSRRSALMPASILACCGSSGRDAAPPAGQPTTVTDNASGKCNEISVDQNNSNDVDEEEGLESPAPSLTRRQSSLTVATQRLDDAMARAMDAYQRARKEVLYGLNEHGRPLEEADGEGGSSDGQPSLPRGPTLMKNLRKLAKRELQFSSSAHGGEESDSFASARTTAKTISSETAGGGLSDGSDEAQGSASTEREEELAAENGQKEIGTKGDGQTAASSQRSPPNHVLVMKERQKMGSSATLARGAFMFSLAGVCANLTKARPARKSSGWRAAHTAQASRFVLSGLWKAVRPPPGLLVAAVYTARLLLPTSCPCLYRDDADKRVRCFKAKMALKRFGSGLGLGAPLPKGHDRKESRWEKFTKSGYFWGLKVSMTLTLCAGFCFSPYLADLFEPALWVPVTTCFVMENQSASAVTTCMMRLIGTVLGAVYGILAAKLTDQPEDDPFGFRSHAILLPWVAVTCFFRNSAQFAYAARVSAFTAVVIFTSSNTVLGADGEAVSLARIVNTVIGSVIYLLVDLLLVPTRAKDLVVEQIYLSLDAAFKEVSINGERMFGPVVCPCDSRQQFLQAFKSSSRPASSAAHSSATLPPPLPPPPPPVESSAGKDTILTHADDEKRQQSINGSGGGNDSPIVEGASSWGRLPSVGELLPGFSSEKPGFLDDESVSLFSSERPRERGRRRHRRWHSAADIPRSDERDGQTDDPSFLRATQCSIASSPAEEKQEEQEAAGEGERKGSKEKEHAAAEETAATQETSTAVVKTRWEGLEKETGYIRKMVSALSLQKHYLPLAELEPQLWYRPFPAEAYQRVVEAEEGLLRALTLLSKAAKAVSEDRSTKWRQELTELGSHLASLVQLLKIGLEDARDVFGGGKLSQAFSHRASSGSDGYSTGFGGAISDGESSGISESEEGQGKRMLNVQADATRLNADVQSDYVLFIQAFMDRGTFPVWELESILRISTAVLSVMGVQKALLDLGHAVATVLDREFHDHYYR